MRFLRKTVNAMAHLREHGLVRTMRYARERFSESYHEWRLGICTVGQLQPKEVGIDCVFASEYYPADYRTIYNALGMLPIRAGVDGFLDFGCGMGRAVTVAATFPFRTVLGVELSPLLADIARANLERAKPRLRARETGIITADAKAFLIPESINVIFFYSPFRGPVLTAALDNIRISLATSPRSLTVVFKNTEHFEPVRSKYPWLVKRREFIASDANHKVMILEAQV